MRKAAKLGSLHVCMQDKPRKVLPSNNGLMLLKTGVKWLQQVEASADVTRDTGQASAALPAERPSAWMPLQILVTACTS